MEGFAMCKIDTDETYGYQTDTWGQAKKEAIRAIVASARNGAPISYSDLTKRISSIGFNPHDYVFHHLLGKISVEEDAAGRGMLSVLVVHKDDGMPGPGFFDLAKLLGRDVSDKERCWSDEARVVLSHCHNHPLAA
jgi:hypothetical protein